MVKFPCSFSGILTLTLSWTLLDVPMNVELEVAPSLGELEKRLRPQMTQLCEAHQPTHQLKVRDCVEGIMLEVNRGLVSHCNTTKSNVDRNTLDSEAQNTQSLSLRAFRSRIAKTLDLPDKVWSNSDLDAVPGWVAGSADDPLDHCGHIWGQKRNNMTVLVVGEYLAIDRDYILRDLLGCLERVRYCVENETLDEDEREQMLAYEYRRRSYAWEFSGVDTMASLGPCSPPTVSRQDKEELVTILVFNLNRWGSPANPAEQDPINNILRPLMQKWRPKILIHLSEEVLRTQPSELLEPIYSQAKLVLRPYYHHQAQEFRSMIHPSQQSCSDRRHSDWISGNVIIVPVGYGRGVLGVRSGVSAAFEWAYDSSTAKAFGKNITRELMWAYVGRLGVHASRGAMSNVFSPGWHPHQRHVDGGAAFNGGGAMSPQEVGHLYRRAKFVPSPPGNSPECFRHYEAIVSGAVPILDGRPTDYVWGQEFIPHDDCIINASSCHELSSNCSPKRSFPAPLGFLFAGMYHPNGSSAESLSERTRKDTLGFYNEGYTLHRRTCAIDIDDEEGVPYDDHMMGTKKLAASICLQATIDHEEQWRLALNRAKAIGNEELSLRQSLNARWYISVISDVRQKVLDALAS